MMRNDYRRALILLRSNGTLYSGHVRLERRTLMASMYFVVQAPDASEELRAALVGCDRSGYFACALGRFRRDSRGQAVLSHSFDPRRLCGRELEQYQLVAVVRGDCEIVLSGNVTGSADLNWAQVRAAVCALYAQEEDGSVGEAEEPVLLEADEKPCPAEASEAGETVAETVGETVVEALAEAIGERAGEAVEEAVGELAEERAEPTAMELLGADASLPWPEEIDALRALFGQQAARKSAPEDGFTYVSAPMPAGSGYAECLAGVRCEDGMPVAVRYALPSAYAPEPPAGLEDAVWIGDNNSGWWVTHIDLHGGAMRN